MGNAESVGMAGTDIGDSVHSGLGTSATKLVGQVASGDDGSVRNIADGGLAGAITSSIKNAYNDHPTVKNTANTIANKGGNYASGAVNVIGGPISGAAIGAENCGGNPGCTAKAADGQNDEGNAVKGLNMSGLEGGLYLESLPTVKKHGRHHDAAMSSKVQMVSHSAGHNIVPHGVHSSNSTHYKKK